MDVKEKEKGFVDDEFLRNLIKNKAVKVTDVASGSTVNTGNVDALLDASKANDQFLQDKVNQAKSKAKTPSVADQVTKVLDPDLQTSKDKQLNAALSRGEKAAQRQKALHEKAKKLDAANLEKEQAQAQKDKEAKEEAARREHEAATATMRRRLILAGQHIGNSTGPLIDRVGSVRTVGGIGLLLGVLAFLLFVVVRVNAQGDTRLKQFWYMLNGRAQLMGRVTVTGAIPGTGNPNTNGNTPLPGSGIISGVGTIPGETPQPKNCRSDPNKVIPLAPPTVAPDKGGCCPDGYMLFSAGLFKGQQGAICVNKYNFGIGGGDPSSTSQFRSNTTNQF